MSATTIKRTIAGVTYTAVPINRALASENTCTGCAFFLGPKTQHVSCDLVKNWRGERPGCIGTELRIWVADPVEEDL